MGRIGLVLAIASLAACSGGGGETESMSGSESSSGSTAATEGSTETATGTASATATAGTESGSATGTTGTSTTTDPSETGTSTTTDTTTTTSTTDATTTTTTTSTTTMGGTDTDAPVCVDADSDGYGDNCDLGPDCDDNDPHNHTEEGCANCADADADTFWTGCDLYDDEKLGPDCDDDDAANHTDEGCANCVDIDMDGYWVGCDAYIDGKPGPDCDDDNQGVGVEDGVEVCNGLSENCAGEIDPLPADQMCPTKGDPPNVAQWQCDPPEPGVDGCKVLACDMYWHDANANPSDGCECLSTDYSEALPACGEDGLAKLGTVSKGQELLDLPKGVVVDIDNGVGNGAEDWYWVEFPEQSRPSSGTIIVDFAANDGADYRFEVFRGCDEAPWANGLATAFGAGAPPALEWSFNDTNVNNAKYSNQVVWPSKVFIRVFRVQNDSTCSGYQLRVRRQN
ncbi:MAG: hypothetical protein R3A79_00490 [Nannocystaceae bacterium]